MDIDDRVQHAINLTEIVRPPRQNLMTFGVTTICYYMVTEPLYVCPSGGVRETVVRTGNVIAEKPKVVTPTYLNRLEGFSENAKRYIEKLVEECPDAPGLYYGYKNEHKGLNCVSEAPEAVILKLGEKLDREGNPLTAIIKGVDELWDVSLLKFIADLTGRSVRDNVAEFSKRGFWGMDRGGATMHGRYVIEQLFEWAERDISWATELKLELDRWGVFYEYEDRFLSLFRKR